ncbi:hypothetical protein TNCV_4419141 [Trichonephila clavipes]|nr:hypothetical protein TNCV_4419141 [Trichonephila clavipes]
MHTPASKLDVDVRFYGHCDHHFSHCWIFFPTGQSHGIGVSRRNDCTNGNAACTSVDSVHPSNPGSVEACLDIDGGQFEDLSLEINANTTVDVSNTVFFFF